ncbi:MAG: SDR family oxidoreductase [Bacteroidota bacterium]
MGNTDHKVVWITGASSGIGEALTYELNDQKYKIIISARRSKELERVCQRCNYPEMVKILPLDLSKFDTLPQKALKAIDCFGKIDILVNNAGVSQRSLIATTDFEVYKNLIDINYLGTVALSKTLLAHFIGNASGHYVTITSLMGKFGSPYRSGYCGAKHALHGFFDVMRMEHEKDGIYVTLVCPGFVRTNVAKNALTADGSPQLLDDQATRNGLDPTFVAKKIVAAMVKRKFEVYVGGKEVKGVYLKRFFPRLLHKVVLKSQVK